MLKLPISPAADLTGKFKINIPNVPGTRPGDPATHRG